ncbi:MAG: hypothetical protein LBQ97_05350 [Fusobacteriaceae bacterium]|jgi:hypothetical protein|nr:hypothetical protein [Fusobacteriaceae bacterium]
MFVILFFILVLIEASLPLNNSLMVISLPFFSYLVNMKKRYAVVGLIALGILLSLQTDNFIRIFITLSIGFFAFDFIYVNVGYNRKSMLAVTLVQLALYCALNYRALSLRWIAGNLLGFLVMNYLLTRGIITRTQ